MKGKRQVRKDDRFLIISKLKDPDDLKKKVRWSNCYGNEDEYTTTIAELLEIVKVDLQSTFQKRGKTIVRQKHGCPIGGFLSPIYAVVKCAKDEYDFLNSLGKARTKIFGIRQVDDLFLMIAYRENDRKSLAVAKKLEKRERERLQRRSRAREARL